jgi:hypothetical protein
VIFPFFHNSRYSPLSLSALGPEGSENTDKIFFALADLAEFFVFGPFQKKKFLRKTLKISTMA